MSRICPKLTSRYVAGRKEASILQKLNEADPEDKKHVVRMERTFEHRGHLCIVTESLRSVQLMHLYGLADEQYESPRRHQAIRKRRWTEYAGCQSLCSSDVLGSLALEEDRHRSCRYQA
jgi:hypothetical protein